MEKTSETMPFSNGSTAQVNTWSTNGKHLAIVSHQLENPFNNGKEPQVYRSEIVNKLCLRWNCRPKDIDYVEQDGKGYMSIPLDRANNGQVNIQDDARGIALTDTEVQNKMNQIEALQEQETEPGQETKEQDTKQGENQKSHWSQGLKMPSRQKHKLK